MLCRSFRAGLDEDMGVVMYVVVLSREGEGMGLLCGRFRAEKETNRDNF